MTTTEITAAVFPVYMQAGGVGKTTITANLGALLAQRGYRVLLIDLDLNGYLTSVLGDRALPGGAGLSAALSAGPRWAADPAGLIRVHQDGMHLIPVDEDRSVLDVMLSNERMREHRLTQFLSRLNGAYDVILVDCQPGESIVTDNVLMASSNRAPGRPSGTIIPVTAHNKSWVNLQLTLAHMRVMADTFGVPVEPLGVVISRFDGRASNDRAQWVARFHAGPVPVLATVHELVAATEAEASGRPVVALRPEARVSGEFQRILSAITGEAQAS